MYAKAASCSFKTWLNKLKVLIYLGVGRGKQYLI